MVTGFCGEFQALMRSKQKYLTVLAILLIFQFPPVIYTQETPSQNLKNPSKCNFKTVHRVIDGDTFELADGQKVRLIGVDTPETVDPRIDVQWFGREASKTLRKWIEGKTVCLRRDIDKTIDIDKYGRLLRYVWKYNGEEGFFVNAELVKQGYGFAYTAHPFQYLEDFRGYERQAREHNRGLWNMEGYRAWRREIEKNKGIARTCGLVGTICPWDAINHVGKYKTVRFFVTKSYDSGETIFLNSKNDFTNPDNFTAVIFKKDRSKFPPAPADFYWGKTLDVRGIIREYNGRAEIVLEDISQIEIVRKQN